MYFRQLDGLYAGWQIGVARSFGDAELEPIDIVLLNAAADLPDMRVYYENFVVRNQTTSTAYATDADDDEYEAPVPHASMLLKFLSDRTGGGSVSPAAADSVGDIPLSDDLRPHTVLIGHSSDGSYAQMLRMLKHYKFHYRRQYADGAHDLNANNIDAVGTAAAATPPTSSSTSAAYATARHREMAALREVAATSVQFTGYPGALASSDDFYIASGNHSKLTVAGIRIRSANVAMWTHVNVTQSVLLAARVMAATRLSHSGYGWARLMSGHTGFGSKQWIVVDVARMHEPVAATAATAAESTNNSTASSRFLLTTRISAQSFELDEIIEVSEEDTTATSGNSHHNWREHLLWVVDQLPGRLHAEDVTQRILGEGKGLWTGNGVPYFNETRRVSGIEHDSTLARSNEWLLGHASIERLADVARALRSRAYRGDLMAENQATSGTVGSDASAKAAMAENAFGNIDLKLYAESSDGSFTFRAFAGPLYYTTATMVPTTTTAAPITAEPVNGETHTAEMAKKERVATSDGDAGQSKTTHADDEIDEHRLSEIDVYAERRPVRDDMRATAMLRSKRGPFRWSQMNDLAVGHSGQPDVFDFEPVSPHWAWT